MKKIALLLLIASASALTQSGCVVGRRTVSLPVPALGGAAETKGDFYVSTIADQRKFENKPSDPSTPSIDGDVTTMSDALKVTMIGRQRNTYGHAMGDITLPADDSVVKRTRLLIEQGLHQRGYHISSDASASSSSTVVIDQFWAWGTPGMWSIGFEARVYCTLTLKKGDKTSTIIVQGYGSNRGQVAKDANWALAYDRAFQDFLTKFGQELDKAGF